MKKIIFLLVILIIASCTSQKRRYQDGFYFSWNKQTFKKQQAGVFSGEPASAGQPANYKVMPPVENEVLNATREKSSGVLSAKKTRYFLQAGPDSCDILLFRNGDEVPVKLIEIGAMEIRYKKCSMPDGPVFVSRKSAIMMVKYFNGSREVFKELPKPPMVTGRPSSPPNHPLAKLSLIFAILGAYPLYILGSILAIIFGTIALNKIRQRPDLYGGETLAKTGRLIGWILLGVAVLYFLITFGLQFLFI